MYTMRRRAAALTGSLLRVPVLIIALRSCCLPAATSTAIGSAASVERPVLTSNIPGINAPPGVHAPCRTCPPVKYDSGDAATIDRQIAQASRAGINRVY